MFRTKHPRRKKCETCNGAGFLLLQAGLAALDDRYPTLPIYEMHKRGWIGSGIDPDGDDVPSCDASFLRFFGVQTHDEVEAILHSSRPFGPERGVGELD